MKIYKDESGKLTIIFSKDEKTSVNLIHDRGAAVVKQNPNVNRYIFHGADAYGDSGYCTGTTTIEWLKESLCTEYKLSRKKSSK